MVNGELIKKKTLYSGTEPLFDGFSSKPETMCYKWFAAVSKYNYKS